MKRLIVLIILFFAFNAHATDWFVCNTASGSNNGTSWANAWESFGDISWASISAGDTVYISGGSGGLTYAETLTIGASGSSGNPITIKTGAAHPTLSSGHDGLVTITGAESGQGIYFNSKDYITVDGNNGSTGSYTNANIKVYQTGSTGVHGVSSSGIKCLYVFTYQTGNAANEHGIDFSGCNNGSEVGWCRVEYPYQDGIRVGSNTASQYGMMSVHNCLIQNVGDDLMAGDGGVDIFNNILGPWCDGAYGDGGHPDGMQLYAGYLRIYNNVFRASNYPNASNCLLFLNHAFGDSGYSFDHVRVYNNLFYTSGACYSGEYFGGISIRPQGDNAGSNDMDDIVIVNNTFVDIAAYVMDIRSDSPSGKLTNCVVKNNIILNCKHSGASGIVSFTNWDFDNSTIAFDNNLIGAGSEGQAGIAWNGSTYTVAGFNTLKSVNNIAGTPLFTDYTAAGGNSNVLSLQSSDTAAQDQGATLSLSNMDPSWPDDFAGTSRPQDDYWDIGAYEYSLDTPYSLGGCSISGGGM